MKFNNDLEIKLNDKTFYIDLSFNGSARLIHYSPAHIDCTADNSYDSEVEYECNEVDISEIDYTLCDDNGNAFDINQLTKKEIEFIEKEITDNANQMVEDYSWSLDELQ